MKGCWYQMNIHSFNPYNTPYMRFHEEMRKMTSEKQLAQDYKASSWHLTPCTLPLESTAPKFRHCMGLSGLLVLEITPKTQLGSGSTPLLLTLIMMEDSPESQSCEMDSQFQPPSGAQHTSLGADQEVAIKPGQTVPVFPSVVIHQAVIEHLLSVDPSVETKVWNCFQRPCLIFHFCLFLCLSHPEVFSFSPGMNCLGGC